LGSGRGRTRWEWLARHRGGAIRVTGVLELDRGSTVFRGRPCGGPFYAEVFIECAATLAIVLDSSNHAPEGDQ